MQLIDTTGRQSLARVIALVALLCTGALQMQEAGHDHYSLDDSYAQCLVCKSSGATLPSTIVVPDLQPGILTTVAETPIAAPFAPITSFLARGPPVFS